MVSCCNWHESCRASSSPYGRDVTGRINWGERAGDVTPNFYLLTRVEQIMAYFLEKDIESGPYTRARVNRERDGLIYEEVFEVGEPVHLQSVYTNADDCEQIWWIRRFSHEQGVAQVFITRKQYGPIPDYSAPVPALVKLPAMLRLALESR